MYVEKGIECYNILRNLLDERKRLKIQYRGSTSKKWNILYFTDGYIRTNCNDKYEQIKELFKLYYFEEEDFNEECKFDLEFKVYDFDNHLKVLIPIGLTTIAHFDEKDIDEYYIPKFSSFYTPHSIKSIFIKTLHNYKYKRRAIYSVIEPKEETVSTEMLEKIYSTLTNLIWTLQHTSTLSNNYMEIYKEDRLNLIGVYQKHNIVIDELEHFLVKLIEEGYVENVYNIVFENNSQISGENVVMISNLTDVKNKNGLWKISKNNSIDRIYDEIIKIINKEISTIYRAYSRLMLLNHI